MARFGLSSRSDSSHRLATRILTTGFVALAATLVFVVPLTPQTQTRTLVITGVNVVDVVDGRVTANTVTVTGQTIAGVTPGGAPPPGAMVVDGRDAFLIPGLWDMHAHMEASGASWLQLYVANGVTGIRDMGKAPTTVCWRPKYRAGLSVAVCRAAGRFLDRKELDALLAEVKDVARRQ